MNRLLVCFVLIETLTTVGFSAQKDVKAASDSRAEASADAFVDDLLANKNEAAMARWNKDNRSMTRDVVDKTLAECGKPVSGKPENAGAPVVGDTVSNDGKTVKTYTFLYPTKLHHLWIEVRPTDSGSDYEVDGIGCQVRH